VGSRWDGAGSRAKFCSAGAAIAGAVPNASAARETRPSSRPAHPSAAGGTAAIDADTWGRIALVGMALLAIAEIEKRLWSRRHVGRRTMERKQVPS